MPPRKRVPVKPARTPTDGAAAGVRLRLQRLPGPLQVLAVGALAALQNEDATFTTAEVAGLYTDLRLPAPANLSSSLSRHATQARLIRPRKDAWALTPSGEHFLASEAANVPTELLAAELGRTSGAEFGQKGHALIPPFLAPAGTEAGLGRLLSTSAFERNVMLITRYPAGPADPFAQLIERLRGACAEHGLNLVLASDGNAEDTLWPNVVTYMWGSKYAIVLMDSADGVLNSNVLIEVGGMLMTGRRCAILRDVSVPKMPTDLVGHIYKPVDLSDQDAAVGVIHDWIRKDLRLPCCDSCPGDAEAADDEA